jgi:hypothetical protein
MNRSIDRRDPCTGTLHNVMVARKGAVIIGECAEMHRGSRIIMKDSTDRTFKAKHGIEIRIT